MVKSGTSLTELTLALTIVGLLCAMAAPGITRSLDGLHVRTAREQVYAVAMRTRALALERGGADLVVDLQTGSVSASDLEGNTAARIDTGLESVAITTDPSSARRIALRYDARGVGRMASRTLVFRKGNAQAGLTFSSYGRVRRW